MAPIPVSVSQTAAESKENNLVLAERKILISILYWTVWLIRSSVSIVPNVSLDITKAIGIISRHFKTNRHFTVIIM